MNKAIFLDRDGVICVEKNLFYNGSPMSSSKDFEWEHGAKDAIRELSSLRDFSFFVITNQSGIGKKIITEEAFQETNRPIHDEFIENGIEVYTYFCPHIPQDKCQCRKPSTELLLQVKKAYDIDLNRSYVVGDKTSDIQLGKNSESITILVETGYAGKDGLYPVKADYISKNLLTAVRLIKKNEQTNGRS